MPERLLGAPSFAAWWILFCTFCVAIGWLLSLVHELNAVGYAIAFLLAAGAVAVWSKRTGRSILARPRWPALRRRFRRILPLGFLALATLAFTGGALYAPANWDALAYRVPRVLHWVAEGRWHWIHTPFERLNLRACGFEWIMAPLVIFTKTDRFFFLINFIAYCQFPPLLFSILSRLGARKRVAYAWMWILPAGYCFLLQAGGLGNDFLPAVFALAAVAYGLRARQEGGLGDFWLSLLAIALCTGVKANNLLLGLLWLAVVAPCWRLLAGWPLKSRGKRRPTSATASLSGRIAATGAIAGLGVIVSFLPTAIFNQMHLGDWTGTRADEMVSIGAGDSVGRVASNCGVLLVQNFAPPFAPFAKTWNARIAPRLSTRAMNEAFQSDNENFPFRMEEMPVEESAGIGLGISALLLGSGLAALWFQRSGCSRIRTTWTFSATQMWVFAGTALATAAFIWVSLANPAEARLMNAYYVFLALPLLVLPGQAEVIRRRFWLWTTMVVMVLAAVPLVLTPSRPLLPMRSVVSLLRQHGWGGRFAERVEKVYVAYGRRPEGLVPLLEFVPIGEKVVGFVGHDDLETGLWKPFGTRRLVHVCAGDTPEMLETEHVRYIIASANGLQRITTSSLNDWLNQFHADLIQTIPLRLRGGEGPSLWYVVRLRP